MVQREAGV